MSNDVLGIVAPHPPIMVPEVGRADADATAASAHALREASMLLLRFAPDTVVIMSPHGTGFTDAFAVTTAPRLSGDLGRFGAPAVRHDVPGDPQLAEAILAAAADEGIAAVPRSRMPGSSELDHGVLVPMRFLDRASHYPLVELSLSYLPYDVHRAFGAVVAKAARSIGRKVAFVASGDCSHRLKPGAPAGYSPRAHLFDEELVRLLAVGDFIGLAEIDPDLIEEAGECGLRSFITLGGFLADETFDSKVLAYEGPWGVGYLSAVFAPSRALDEVVESSHGVSAASAADSDTPGAGSKGGQKGSDESEPVRLARETLEAHIGKGCAPDTCTLQATGLPARAGCFVSLHSHGQLRGCIGTIAPVCDTLAEEIRRNAVEAATRDPRFPPVGPDELDALDVKVDVLHDPEPVDSLDDLDPKVYGVIVTSGWRRGLLLPDLEGVDTVEEQVSIAMRKAGIAPGEPICLERFKVDRHE